MSPPIKKTMAGTNDAAAKSRALAQREAKVRNVKVAKARRSMVFAAAIILPIGFMVLLAVDYIYRPGSFKISEVQYEGVFERVEHREIDEITRGAMYGNFFTVNLDYVRSRLESEPWVKRAAIRREWPGKVVVRVFEHQPVMRWKNEAWVSSSAQKIAVRSSELNDPTFKSLVSLSGGDGDSRIEPIMMKANQWGSRLQAYDLHLSGLERTDSGAWTLTVESSVRLNADTRRVIKKQETQVLLGSDRVKERFERLLRMVEQNGQLLSASKVIDVRYPNGVAILPTEDAVVDSVDPS